MILDIGLDLDNTVCNFWGPYVNRFGLPHSDYEISKNVNRILIKDKEFWLNLPVINKPNFTPALYCTKRVHPKAWSKEFLKMNDLPIAPIYQVYCQIASKAPRIKGRVDVFVDDSLSNFIDLNLKGIPCLLIDDENNRKWGPIGRIFTLDKEEIEDCYNLFLDTVFFNFKELLYEYQTNSPN